MTEFVAKTVGERIGYGLCLCSRCGQVGRCTPDTDYFSTPGTPGPSSPLVCEACLINGVKTFEVRPKSSCPKCQGSGRVPGTDLKLKDGSSFTICSCANTTVIPAKN